MRAILEISLKINEKKLSRSSRIFAVLDVNFKKSVDTFHL